MGPGGATRLKADTWNWLREICAEARPLRSRHLAIVVAPRRLPRRQLAALNCPRDGVVLRDFILSGSGVEHAFARPVAESKDVHVWVQRHSSVGKHGSAGSGG